MFQAQSPSLFRSNNCGLQHSGGVDFTTPLHVPTVTIPKSDHDSLVSTPRLVEEMPTDSLAVDFRSSVW
jgi:hypothetical protein